LKFGAFAPLEIGLEPFRRAAVRAGAAFLNGSGRGLI
jgi:hypothetical protein